MTTPGQRVDMPRGEPTLAERIKREFDARVVRLDELQNAEQMTGLDLAFLKETEQIIQGLESQIPEGLDRNSTGPLETLRVLFDAANGNMDRVGHVLEGGEKEKKKKESKKPSPVVMQEEIDEDEPGEASTTEFTEANFEGNEDAEAWFSAVRELESLVDTAEETQGSAQEAAFISANDEYNRFMMEEYLVNADAAGGEDVLHDEYPYFKVVAARLDSIAERLEEYFSSQEPEAAAEAGESREAIWNRFNEEIQELNGQINTLLDMPTDTDPEVQAARETFDIVIENMKEYGDDWKKTVSPILDGLQKGRWGAWGVLNRDHGTLIRRFFGRKAKAEGEETIEGVIQQFGRRLRDRSREIRERRWEQEFPNFAVDVAKTIVNIQDARLRTGVERGVAMGGVEESFISLQEEWKVLRTGGPRISREDRERGERSLVNQYDVMMRSLSKDIPILVKSALKARSARLDDVAFLWREALVRTGQFWRAGTDFKEKISFLRRYASGEAEDAEIEEMIRSVERENFASVAESDVLADLRARGAQKRERREQTERRERAQLYHPNLEIARMDAKDLYRRAINASFWKDEVTMEARQKLFAADAPKIEDEELKDLVKNPDTDIPTYRRFIGMVNTQYIRVKKLEDEMYIEGKQPEGKANAKKMRRAIERFLEAEEREISAWKRAKTAPGWRADVPRDRTLRDEFDRFLNMGQRAFDDEGFRRAHPALQNAIIDWTRARLRLRTIGIYAQWLIDENPVLAQSVQNMPRAFVVPEKAAPADAEDDADEGVEQVSDEERAELVLPEQEVRTGDDAGGGAFEGLEERAAVDSASRDGEEEGEGGEASEASAGGTSEGGTEGREGVLAEDGREIIRKLVE